MSALVILLLVVAALVGFFWEELRDISNDGKCKHGIPLDSYCVPCQARRDRHDH